MRNEMIRYALALVMVLCSAPTLWGYQAYAHWLATPSDIQSQSSLPDMWPSPEQYLTAGYIGGEASPYFAWSHCCQRTGVSLAWPLMWPNEPTEYEDSPVCCPGVIMAYLYNNKLGSGNRDPLMEKTAKGFRVHNKEDKTVHFSYFLGGTPDNWLYQHLWKEGWADCAIYACNGGVWDEYGDPATPGTTDVRAHAGIMNLAQKVYRKMRPSVDLVAGLSGNRKELEVQEASTIQGLIDLQHGQLATVLKYDDLDWEAFQHDASTYHWQQSDLILRWLDAVYAANEAIASWPPSL
jgi:hypothetical protein